MEIKTKQLTVLLLSTFIFTLGFGITVPIMPFFAKSMGGTVVDVGILMALFSLAELVFAPVWGKVSDRFGRKPVIMIGLLGFGLAFTATGLSTSLLMLYGSQLIAGALAAGIFPAVMASIADQTEPEQRGRYMGLLGAASGLGIIVGPVSASVIALLGLNVPYFAAAALGLITAAVALVWLPETRLASKSGPTKQANGWRLALKPQLLIFFLMMLFVCTAMASLESTLGFFTMDRYGLSETASAMPILWTTIELTGTNLLGIAYLFFGVAGVLTQVLLVGKLMEKAGETRTIALGFLMVGAGTILLVLAGEMSLLLLASLVIAVGIGLLQPSLITAVSNRTDKEHQGVTMGLLGSFNSAGRAAGPIAGGLAYSVSWLLPYALSAAVSLFSALLILVWRTKGDREHNSVKALSVEQ
ncbi:MAG TPA: MFS transporter [Methanocella sp.]|jgi:MFS family permease